MLFRSGFDILLTIDKNILREQNFLKFKLTVVVLNSISSKVEELAKFVPHFKSRLGELENGKVYLIDKH